jgi:hypothetical protein
VYRAELLEVLFEQMLGRLTAHSADLTRVAAALPADFLFAGLEFQRHGFAGPQPGNRQPGENLVRAQQQKRRDVLHFHYRAKNLAHLAARQHPPMG